MRGVIVGVVVHLANTGVSTSGHLKSVDVCTLSNQATLYENDCDSRAAKY